MSRARAEAALLLAAGTLLLAALARGQTAADAADVVLRALEDELARSETGLAAQGEPVRYVAYLATEDWSASASAVLGALTGSELEYHHHLGVDVRVGDADVDSSLGPRGRGFSTRGLLPIEPDYALVRRVAWLATDELYRSGARMLADQRERRDTQVQSEDPPRFSDEPAHVRLDPVSAEQARRSAQDAHARLPELVRSLSRVVRERPEIEHSGVSASYARTTRRLVTSGGMRTRDAAALVQVDVALSTRVEDGSTLATTIEAVARSLDELPPAPALAERVAREAERLLALRAAPVVEPYTGPVLFEGEAAAQLVALTLAPAFDGTPLPQEMARYAGMAGQGLLEQLGQRVLPKGVRVLDDPLLAEHGGARLFGGYAVDEEGVPVQKVELVRDGMLQAVLTSRRTGKRAPRSNGHARAGGVAPSNLIVSATGGLRDAALRARLISEARKQGLSRAIVVRRLFGGWPLELLAGMGRFGGQRPMPALEIVELGLDGKERPVRNAIVAGLDLTRLRNATALGTRPFALTLASRSAAQACSIVSPAWLLADVEIRKIEPGGDKPPELPHPLLPAK